MRLHADALRREAARLAGRADFGADPFAENLERLLDALAAADALTPEGLETTRAELTGYLRNRLEVQRWLARMPWIEARPIVRPIFFMGLPRSGTTFLLHLFDHDPRLRLLRTWESREPAPPPALDPESVARRIESARRFVGSWQGEVEGFDALHLLDAEGPDECGMLLANAFAQAGFPNYLEVPGWFGWMLESLDFDAAYRLHRQQLQVLQHGAPERRWALKFPNHLLAVPAIRRVYPDAAFVYTHRDPDTALASLCSLTCELRAARSRRVDRRAVGREMSVFVARHVERILAFRSPASSATTGAAGSPRAAGALDGAVVVDVDYDRLVADPVAVTDAIYAAVGMPMADAVAARLARWTAENPKGRRGAHRYAAGDFALDPAETEAVFAAYRARFGIRREAQA